MIKKRHRFWWRIAKPFIALHFKRLYGYKAIKFNIKKDENYIVLMNHTFGADPLMGSLSFKRSVAYVITDDVNNRGIISKLLNHVCCLIPKRKGSSDINTVKTMLKAAKEKDTIIICPEGNRTYSGELCYISMSIVKLVRKMKLPILLYANEGGYGVEPRWSRKKRKGKVYGHVREVISLDEINKLSDEKLYDRIINGLQILYNPNDLYKSKYRAEGIERALFVCPKCGSIKTITSKKEMFWCTNCNAKAEYTENQRIKSDDFEFNKIYDWYLWQLEWIKKYDFNHDNIIFEDNNLELSVTENRKKTIISSNVTMKQYKDKFVFSYKEKNVEKEFILNMNEIDDMSPLMKKKLSFNVSNKVYVIKGEIPFSSIKNLFMYYHIKNVTGGNTDEYFGI